MNSKTTWWLFALAVALFTFIFLFERKLPDRQRPLEPTRLVPGFDPSQVNRLDFAVSNLVVVRAARTNDSWMLTSPVKYPAQTGKIDHLLASLRTLDREPLFSSAEFVARPHAASEFGLNPPQASLIVYTANDRKEFLLGNRTPPGNQVYLQLVGTPGIFLSPAGLWERLPYSPDDWRDTALISLQRLPFDRIRVRSGTQGFELLSLPEAGEWQLNEPVRTRADSVKVQALLRMVGGAEVKQFVAGAPGAVSGLDAPEVVLSFNRGSNELLHLQFGKPVTNQPALVYARRSDQTNLVLVSRTLLDELRADYQIYRDRQLLPFPRANVDLIEVQARETFSLVRQTNHAWALAPPHQFRADPALAEELLSVLSNLRIAEFIKEVVTDFSAYGLAPPAAQFTLSRRGPGATNTPLARLQFGSSVPDHAEWLFCHRNDETAVYAVRADALHLPAYAVQLRDRQVWSFAVSNVVALTIKEKGEHRRFLQTAPGEWSLPSQDYNLFAVAEAISELSALRAEAWRSDSTNALEQFGFSAASPQLQLEVRSNSAVQTQTVVLTLGGVAPARRFYAWASGEDKTGVFEISALLSEQIKVYLRVGAGAPAP